MQEVERFKGPAGFQENSAFPDHSVISELDDENELILIKTPWNFDLSLLNGVEIPLKGRHVLQTGHEKNVVVNGSKSSELLNNISVVTKPDDSYCVISGKLRFKKQIEISECYDFPAAVIPDVEPCLVPKVNDLRVRFIPYGSRDPVVRYKRKISECSDSPDRKSSPKKKKKRRKSESNNTSLEIDKKLEDSSKKKKKDKRKMSEYDDSFLPAADNTNGIPEHVKVKKSKKHFSTSESDDNVSSSKARKKRKENNSEFTNSLSNIADEEVPVFTKLKKSKKHIISNDSDDPEISSKSKKKRKGTISNEEIPVTTEVKKSRKHFNATDSDDPEIPSKKEGRRKHKRNTSDEETQMTTEAKAEGDRFTKHKKSKSKTQG